MNENAVEWVELLIDIPFCIILSVEQRVGNITYKLRTNAKPFNNRFHD